MDEPAKVHGAQVGGDHSSNFKTFVGSLLAVGANSLSELLLERNSPTFGHTDASNPESMGGGGVKVGYQYEGEDGGCKQAKLAFYEVGDEGEKPNGDG